PPWQPPRASRPSIFCSWCIPFVGSLRKKSASQLRLVEKQATTGAVQKDRFPAKKRRSCCQGATRCDGCSAACRENPDALTLPERDHQPDGGRGKQRAGEQKRAAEARRALHEVAHDQRPYD